MVSNLILIFIVVLVNFPISLYSQEKSDIKFFNYNIILISIDTLRADHLGCYGYPRSTSPNVDKFAKEGIIFEQAISQAGATLPSHASIFTSQYPFVHGADTVATDSPLDEAVITLAEVLNTQGYKTAAFTGGGHLRAEYGLNQGFDVYYDRGDWNSPLGSFNNTIPLAFDWIKNNKKDRFFLFLHGYDVHVPYSHPKQHEHIFDEGYKGIVDKMDLSWEGLAKVYNNIYLQEDGKLRKLNQRDIGHIIAHYDAGIKYVDTKIGEFLQEMQNLGLLDDTIVIILADHGEDLFEHGHIGKHRSPYEGTIHVPLIIIHPDIKKKIIRTQVQLIDIMPTILDFLNITISIREVQGKSLLPVIKNRVNKNFNRYVYSHYGNGIVRSRRWKLIDKFALYDLENDPNEQHNIIDKNPITALIYLQKLYEWTRENDILKWKIINRLRGLPKSEKETIRSNGYW